VTTAALAENTRPTIARHLVLALLALAMTSAYITRVCLAPLTTTIQADLHLTNTQMGLAGSAFFFGYLWLQVPGGWLGNRYGSRIMLPIFAVVWSLCSLWTGAVGGFVGLILARTAMGLAQAGLIPVSAKATLDWSPFSDRGKNSSVIGASMSLGGVITTALTTMLLTWLTWRQIYFAYTAIGVAWAAVFYSWYRDRPEMHRAVNAAELARIRERPIAAEASDEPAEPAPKSRNVDIVVAMLTSSSMWMMCLTAFFRAFGAAFFLTFFPAYLEKARGFDVKQSGFLATLPLIATVLGALVGGVIIDRLMRATRSLRLSRSGVAAVSLGLCTLCIFFATTMTDPLPAVYVIAFGAFLSAISGPSSWAATMDIAGEHTSVVFGVANVAGNIGAMISPIVVGALMDFIVKRQGDWNWVLYLFVGIYFFSAFFWALLNPNRSAVERSPKAGARYSGT
jgi:MFS family permease